MFQIRVVEVERFHDLFRFRVSAEGVEIACDDDGSRIDRRDLRQIIELFFADLLFQSEMDEEEADPADIEFEDQFFEPCGEIIGVCLDRFMTCEESVCLFSEDRDISPDGIFAVFDPAVRIVFEFRSDESGLIEESGPERSRIDLDETCDIGIAAVDESGDLVEEQRFRPDVSMGIEDASDPSGGPGPVSDIVNKQSHPREILFG